MGVVELEDIVVTKRCSMCGERKPHHEFGRHKLTTDGRQSYCRDCHRKDTWARRQIAKLDSGPAAQGQAPQALEAIVVVPEALEQAQAPTSPGESTPSVRATPRIPGGGQVYATLARATRRVFAPCGFPLCLSEIDASNVYCPAHLAALGSVGPGRWTPSGWDGQSGDEVMVCRHLYWWTGDEYVETWVPEFFKAADGREGGHIPRTSPVGYEWQVCCNCGASKLVWLHWDQTYDRPEGAGGRDAGEGNHYTVYSRHIRG